MPATAFSLGSVISLGGVVVVVVECVFVLLRRWTLSSEASDLLLWNSSFLACFMSAVSLRFICVFSIFRSFAASLSSKARRAARMLAARAEGSSGSEVRERKPTALSKEVRDEALVPKSKDVAVLRDERAGLKSWAEMFESTEVVDRLDGEVSGNLEREVALRVCER